MTVSTSQPVSWSTAIQAQLTRAQLQALWKWRWHDRLVSLWAPVLVLALFFAIYLTIIESIACSYLWLQPVMQLLGCLCFFWWVALIVARLAFKKWNAARKARYRAEEVLSKMKDVFQRHLSALKNHAIEDCIKAGVDVAKVFQNGSEAIIQATKRLEAKADLHLSRFKRSSVIGGFMRALLVALAFRALLIEPFKIPSGSMIPTLEIGDQIFVNKFIYGVRLPFTNYVPFVIVRQPQRGDVIVFNNPVLPEFDYIKRIIGIPGDRIEFTGEGVHLNGQLLPVRLERADYVFSEQLRAANESFLDGAKRWFTNDWFEVKESLYSEKIGEEHHYILENRVRRSAVLRHMSEHVIEVPKGHVFVMGDNRNHSLDGRLGLGGHPGNRPAFVPYGHIKGKAMVIWLSLGRGGLLSTLFGGTGITYDRFFKPVSICMHKSNSSVN